MRILSLLQAGKHAGLTAFFSPIYYAAFLPAAVLLYAIMPKKLKKYALLLESLGFFWLVSGVYIGWLLAAICLTWGCGLWLDRILQQRDWEIRAAEKPQRKQIRQRFLNQTRLVLAVGAVGDLSVLLVLKYAGFFTRNLNRLLGTEMAVPNFVMPIGISFYTLQAIAYLFDVYRGTVKADRNILRLTLFLSFFPQIVEGPICRYSQTAEALWNSNGIRYENLTHGIQRILYGMLKKIVVADRLNAFIEGAFTGYSENPGGLIAVAAVCYTVQLYMDFSGSMDAVTGVAEIFGVTMPENFRQPFFSSTISEFWNRWHISLGAWFRDYLFYPITMSKPMKKLTGAARKKLGNHFGPLLAGAAALLCVWFCNGVWHGAAWSFIFFGMYHFVLILSGSLIAPIVKRVHEKLRISPQHPVYRGFQIVRTWILVVIGELFFRADGLRNGLAMFRKMVTDFSFDGLTWEWMKKEMSIDPQDFLIVGITLGIVLVMSLLHERGISVRQRLGQSPRWLRWIVLYALIVYVILFGAYGADYMPVNPMYANF